MAWAVVIMCEVDNAETNAKEIVPLGKITVSPTVFVTTENRTPVLLSSGR
jgi:hypothetical protein